MSRKLLLADDSITIQKVIGITFVNEDFDLTVVDNGDSALEQARAQRPDLILADVFMPGKNGYELCAAVKADPVLAGVPVLLLTGTFEPFDEGKASSAGADGWIAKPFESQTLIARVRELLDKGAETLAPSEAPQPTVESPVEAVESFVSAGSVPGTEAEAEADIWEDFDEVPVAEVAPEAAVADEDVPEASDFGDIFGPEEEEAAAEVTADDIWGDVSFEDEDLAVEAESAAGSDLDDIWGTQEEVTSEPLQPVAEEEPFAFAEVSDAEVVPEIKKTEPAEVPDDDLFVFEEDEGGGSVSAQVSTDDDLWVLDEEPLSEKVTEVPEPVEEELMELGEEDILLLEEAEILDEDDLGFESTEDDFVFVDEEAETEPSASLEASTLTDEDLFGDVALVSEPELEIPEPELEIPEPELEIPEPELEISEPELEISEPELEIPEPELEIPEPELEIPEPELEIPEPELEIPEPELEIPEPELEIPEPELEIPEPELEVPVAAQAGAVESRVQALSDEELEAIVEKVAGAVIERLAGTILEKIAWEVVPDLAEALIKEEIRLIKEDVK